MSTTKKILLITHIFPPTPGIGGRRWAKFAKYLARNGNGVFVICAEHKVGEQSNWKQDVSDPNIQVFPLPLRYPAVIGHSAKSVFEKIKYKLALALLKLRTKGNYYDRAQFWKPQLQEKALELIRKYKISNVIVSGAPFHLLPAVVELKEKADGLNVICDLRDPWLNNAEFYGMATLSPERKKHETELEKYVATHSDVVTTVADGMTEYFSAAYPESKTKFVTLLNGFDEEDFPARFDYARGPVNPFRPAAENDKKLKFIFTGTLYPGTDYLYRPLLDALTELKVKHPEIYKEMEFHFYGKIPADFSESAKAKGLDAVQCHGSIPLSAVHKKIAEADLGMLFLNRSLGFSLSTKYFEYLSQHKKIAVFSDLGETQDFVIQNKIGYGIQPENIKEKLMEIYSDFKSGKLLETSEFDISVYSIASLTASLEKLFV